MEIVTVNALSNKSGNTQYTQSSQPSLVCHYELQLWYSISRARHLLSMEHSQCWVTRKINIGRKWK